MKRKVLHLHHFSMILLRTDPTTPHFDCIGNVPCNEATMSAGNVFLACVTTLALKLSLKSLCCQPFKSPSSCSEMA